MLIRDRRHVIVKVIKTELRGMFQPGLTCATNVENGSPLSLAKAQTRRDTEANMFKSEIMKMITCISTKIVAPVLDFVLFGPCQNKDERQY